MLLASLTGCTSRPEPKEAVETFINAEIYGKEIDKYKEIFKVELTGDEDYTQEFLEGFESTSGIELEKEDAKNITDQLFKRLQKDTSFKITKVDEDEEKRQITVALRGLDFAKDIDRLSNLMEEEMISILKEKGYPINSTADIQNLEPEKAKEIVDLTQDKKFLGQVSAKALDKYLAEVPINEKPSIIVIQLVPNKDDRSAWTVSNRSQLVKKIMQTLLGGQ